MSFEFPKDTCEKREERERDVFPRQPYSFIVNILSLVVLFVYLFITRDIFVRFLIFTFILFQAWHAFSHFVHIENSTLQSNMTHFLIYLIAVASIIVIPHLAHTESIFSPSSGIHLPIILLLFVLDMWILIHVKGLWMIISGLSVLAYVYVAQVHAMPKEVVNYRFGAIIFLFLTLLFEINEAINCERMQRLYPFPYHVLLEVSGLMSFVFLAHMFYVWQARQ